VVFRALKKYNTENFSSIFIGLFKETPVVNEKYCVFIKISRDASQ
jgi:hypothetical protein